VARKRGKAPGEIRTAMKNTIDQNVGVFRDEAHLKQALKDSTTGAKGFQSNAYRYFQPEI